MSAPFQIEISLNRDVVPAGREAELFLMVKAAPTREVATVVRTHRRRVHMAFVVDSSGSMCGEKLETAKEAILRRYRSDLEDEDMLSLIIFSDFAQVVVAAATKKGGDDVEAKVKSAQCGGLTNLYEGIEKAVGILSETPPGYLRVMVVATDGMPTTGVTDPDRIVGLVKRAREDHSITTFVYGIGSDYDLKLCDEMAKAGGGAVKHASKPQELEGLTQVLTSTIKGAVAPRLALDLRPEAGVELTEAVLLAPRLMPLEPAKRPWDVGMVTSHDVVIATFKLRVGARAEGRQRIAAVTLGAVTKDVEVQSAREAPFIEARPDARLYHVVGVRVANIVEKVKNGLDAADEYRLLDSLLSSPEASDLMVKDPFFARLINSIHRTRVADERTKVDVLTRSLK